MSATNDVLVLNYSFEAMDITRYQRAVQLIFKGKAEIVHSIDREICSGRGFAMPMPSIIRMLYYIKRPKQTVSLSKHSVILRDKSICQYCAKKFPESLLTIDHVFPKSRGGPSSWENLVAACTRCNNRKNDRTPKEANMKLLREPKQPRHIPWIRVRAMAKDRPEMWGKFLFWEISIEEQIEA